MRLMTVNGRLASDVTRQISKQGTEFINFSIGNNEFGDPKSSDGVAQTQWFRVTSFNPQHIKLAKYLTKGKPIIVTGRYSNRLYQSQKTGQWGIDNEIIANDICFEIGGERNADGTQNGNGASHNTATRATNSFSDGIDGIPQVTSAKMGSQTVSQTATTATEQANVNINNDDDELPF